MSTIGDDSANATVVLMGKGVDVTAKAAEMTANLAKDFLSWLVNSRSRSLEKTLKNEQINMTKNENALISAQVKMAKDLNETVNAKMVIQEGRGIVQAKVLLKSGEQITVGAAALNERQQQEFARHAKNYGLTYALIKNDYDPSNKKLLMFAQKDLQKVKDITDRMTENAQITEIEKRIGQLKAKGAENFSKQDYLDLSRLEDLRNGKIMSPMDVLNNDSNKKTFEEISAELKEQQELTNGSKQMTFDRMLNHVTDRDWYVSKEPYYVAERTKPNNYIELDSRREKDFRGKDYTKTYYSVYKDNEKAGDWNDGRFTGRPPGYWQNVKDEMKEKGSFTDDVIIFKSRGEFDQYVTAYNESIARAQSQELGQTLFDMGAYFDYSTGEVIDRASDQLAREKLKELELEEARLTEVKAVEKDPEILNQIDTEIETNAKEQMRLTTAMLIGDLIKIEKNLEILQAEEARLSNLMRDSELSPRDSHYLMERLNEIKAEQANFTEIGLDKANQRARLNSLEVLRGMSIQDVPETDVLKDPGRTVENGAITGKVEDLIKTDWRAAVDKGKPVGVLEKPGPAVKKKEFVL